jgi:hypothetical protein
VAGWSRYATTRFFGAQTVMSALRLTRRSSLLLPFLLAACGGEPIRAYRPLRYAYLKPIELAVKSVEIAVRFVPSGVRPDISGESPIDPVATLGQMGEDRLKALGSAARAVLVISDASLIRRNNEIQGSMEATLEIVTDDGQSAGYAQARVNAGHTGRVDDLQQVLYDMVSGMMDDMNIELEHQIRTQLKTWLAEEATPVPAVPAPVEAAPLASPLRY